MVKGGRFLAGGYLSLALGTNRILLEVNSMPLGEQVEWHVLMQSYSLYTDKCYAENITRYVFNQLYYKI